MCVEVSQHLRHWRGRYWAIVLRLTQSIASALFSGVIRTQTGPVISFQGASGWKFPLAALIEVILLLHIVLPRGFVRALFRVAFGSSRCWL